jgi:hypothetical protein
MHGFAACPHQGEHCSAAVRPSPIRGLWALISHTPARKGSVPASYSCHNERARGGPPITVIIAGGRPEAAEGAKKECSVTWPLRSTVPLPSCKLCQLRTQPPAWERTGNPYGFGANWMLKVREDMSLIYNSSGQYRLPNLRRSRLRRTEGRNIKLTFLDLVDQFNPAEGNSGMIKTLEP